MSAVNYKELIANALLDDTGMSKILYQEELEKLENRLLKSLIQCNNDFVFAVTAHNSDVAMALIKPTGKTYINEDAKRELKNLWKEIYKEKINELIPHLVSNLERGAIPIQTVKILINSSSTTQ